MRAIRTLLILSHRYIGIPLSFLFVVWFFSAYFMIYAGGMPRLTPAMQIEAASPLDLSLIMIPPAEIVDRIGYDPTTTSLRTVLGRPVYALGTPGFPIDQLYADDGSVLTTLSQAESVQLAAGFLKLPASNLQMVGTLNAVDQWTISNAGDLPLYKFAVADEAGTEIYVSPGKATVAVVTTSRSRTLAWLGTIPHWFYFDALRANQPFWYALVVWSAGIGSVLALLGLGLGITQFRKVRPFKLQRAIPYGGAMRWHYITGVVFGVITLTWVFSGLLSMEPFAWTNARGLEVDSSVFDQGDLDLGAFGALNDPVLSAAMPANVKQLELVWRQNQPYLLASYSQPMQDTDDKRDRLHQPYNIAGQSDGARVLINPVSRKVLEGFDPAVLSSQLDASVSEASVTQASVLNDYDDYYYSRQGELPLPVLRVKFDDPAQSWVYVDPQRGELLSLVHRWSRVERWLYNGLHSLDFAFWYHRRPLWDIGVLLLLTGGFASSLLGFYFGMRRLWGDLKRVACWLAGKQSSRKFAAGQTTPVP